MISYDFLIDEEKQRQQKGLELRSEMAATIKHLTNRLCELEKPQYFYEQQPIDTSYNVNRRPQIID